VKHQVLAKLTCIQIERLHTGQLGPGQFGKNPKNTETKKRPERFLTPLATARRVAAMDSEPIKKPRRKDGAFPAVALLSRNDAHVTAVERAFYFKLDHAFDFREEGVIFTHAYAVTGVELGTALTHDDVARNDFLAAIHLNAKAFGF
jgi:hypothetical protein